MSSQPLAEPTHKRWVRKLRIFTGLSTLIFLAGTVESVRDGSSVLVALCLPWLLSGLVVLWRVRSDPPHKKGLSLAFSVGAFWGVLSILSLLSLLVYLLQPLPFSIEHDLVPLLFLMGFSIIHMGMAYSAKKTSHSPPQEAAASPSTPAPAGLKVGRTFAAMGIILLALAIITPILLRNRSSSPESYTIGSLRMVATVNGTYADTYQQGFAGTLAQLGPPSAACPAVGAACADLLDEVLSGVNPATPSPALRGYQFIYLAPNPASSSDQPNATFSVVAVPVTPGQSGTSTFCVDHTYVLLRDTSGQRKTATDSGCNWPIGGSIGPL